MRDDSSRTYIDVVLTSTFKILDSCRRLTVICVDKTFAENWCDGHQASGFPLWMGPWELSPGRQNSHLTSCSIPVVLRPRPAGGFGIVGDVCAQDFTQEEIGIELTDNWPEIEIY